MNTCAIALFALLVALCGAQIAVPDGALQGIRQEGLAVLSAAVKSSNHALEVAIEEFVPINKTCNGYIDTAIAGCRSCVEQKCTDRAKAVCKPEKWQEILGKTIVFFKDGIPGFFSQTIPDVFVNKIGGGVVDVTKDIGGFFKDTIGGGIVDVGKNIGSGVVDIGNGIKDGVVDFGKGIGSGVVDLGKKIGGGVVDVGNKIKDGIDTAINGIKDIGGKIGGVFGSIFGKRSLLDRLKRSAEPDCGAFERDPNTACQVYLSASFCPKCGFDPSKECPGYKAALDKIQAADASRGWMTKITSQSYNIVSMTFNPAAIDATGGFKNVQVSVQLFGKDLSFTVKKPINPYIPNVAGPIIAEQALELFKSS